MAAAPAQAPPTRYTLAAAARILGMPPVRLTAWKRLGLLTAVLAPDGTVDLAGLARLRRLAALNRARLTDGSIRRSVEAMQRRYGIADPLADHMPLPQGARLVFRHAGSLLDPLTQQFGFDFDIAASSGTEPLRMTAGHAAIGKVQPHHAAQDSLAAQHLFAEAVRLEERAGTADQAAALYRDVLRLCPTHAPASINLGTLLYNGGNYIEAEQAYRAAAELDPDYALAFFNLGNVLDELQRLPEAVAAYTRAIQIVPDYADVHYNLALAFERLGERRRALRHWMRYVRLDPIGPWAAHARAQAKKALATEKLSIVSRYGRAS